MIRSRGARGRRAYNSTSMTNTVTRSPRSAALDGLFTECRHRPFPFLLETALIADESGAVSLLGSDPFAVLIATGRHVEILEGGRRETRDANPFDVLRSLLARVAGESERPEAVQVVGFLGYDLARHLERLPERAERDQRFPDMLLGFYDRTLLVDHASGAVSDVREPGDRPRAIDETAYAALMRDAPPAAGANFDRATYLSAIARARELIREGEIYQVNLSQRFAARFEGDSFDLYRRLRHLSPAPYAAYLELGNRAVVSSSPEEFFRVDPGVATTRPIKGTRPRGGDEAEDGRLAEELLSSAKDDAELVMIVDLERNDLGRIAVPGSVHVPVMKAIERHPTVWHLSATVTGRLREGIGPVEVLENAFPGGSVTGAPKIRAMQVIDELEPTRRSVFTGAIAWLTPGGSMRSSVAIRTMQVHDSLVTFQVGGAIVWDSDPGAEYRETLVKARGMAEALGIGLE